MECPHCGRPGKRYFGGYCTKSHHDLNKKPRHLHLECANCGRAVVRSPSQVSKGGKVYCPRCPINSGESHPNWKEGQYLNPAGYRLILVKGSYQLEHIYTWEHENSSCILKECVGKVHVHHINKIKQDNRPENLVLLSSRVHGQIHRHLDNGRSEEAKTLVINACSQQAFFISNPKAILALKQLDFGNL